MVTTRRKTQCTSQMNGSINWLYKGSWRMYEMNLVWKMSRIFNNRWWKGGDWRTWSSYDLWKTHYAQSNVLKTSMQYLHESPRKLLKCVIIFFSLFADKQPRLREVICSSRRIKIQRQNLRALKIYVTVNCQSESMKGERWQTHFRMLEH